MKSYSWLGVVNSMPSLERFVKHSDALAAIEQANQWQLAVDQLLSGWHSTADRYASPHEAVKALIAFEVTAALDPKVSSDAAALVAWRGYQAGHADGVKEAARGCMDLCTYEYSAQDCMDAIRAEYPEAFTSDPPAARPDKPPTA